MASRVNPTTDTTSIQHIFYMYSSERRSYTHTHTFTVYLERIPWYHQRTVVFPPESVELQVSLPSGRHLQRRKPHFSNAHIPRETHTHLVMAVSLYGHPDSYLHHPAEFDAQIPHLTSSDINPSGHQRIKLNPFTQIILSYQTLSCWYSLEFDIVRRINDQKHTKIFKITGEKSSYWEEC